MSNYKDHAMREFKAAGWDLESDAMQKMMCDQVLELLEKFSTHGHTGSTAPYAINMFTTLAKFEPLVPLTGEDWEWNDISDMSDSPRFQNSRCSHVFKDGDRCYDIQGRIFTEPTGCSYSGRDSHVDITFPYTPKTVYVKVDLDGNAISDDLWESKRAKYLKTPEAKADDS